VVERTFGSIKKWFSGWKTRYIGLRKTHTQHVLQAIAYNLKRSPGIIISHSLK
jgi:IS5 family transposase